ncbi:MAG: oligogalacturonate lyase family protein [Acidobacteriales bacterium]|nr:oligogalacturonate lyase family protein [Terriglobales bacterium]
MLDEKSPRGLRVVQITTDPNLASWNVYTEAPVFTPDSRRFVFIRERNYWLCDIADGFALRQLTDERGAKGASVSPDGKWMYYIVDDPGRTGAALVLKRLSLKNYRRKVLLTVKDKLPGTNYRPSRLYSLTSLSSDGRRLATSCFLGDRKTAGAPFGLLVFQLDRPSVRVFPLGADYNNMHAQYCRSQDPERSHDILIQHNHGSVVDASGKTLTLVGGEGADLHVMRDDGTKWRDIPIGRDGREYVQGHQQWRGRMASVMSAMSIRRGKKRILEGFSIPTSEASSHMGSRIAGGRSWDVTRDIENPEFWHFSVDDSGMKVVSDTNAIDPVTKKKRITLVIGSLTAAENPLLKLRYLLDTRTSGTDQPAHPHPFFSPDSRMAFFNSDMDGKPQVWMVTGYQFPE